MSAEPELSVVAPLIAKVPLSVTAPPAVTLRLAALNAFRSKAVVSTIVTALPLSVAKVTVPAKALLASSKVIASLLPEVFVKVASPVTARVPLSVIAPPEVIPKVPLTVLAPKSVAAFSVTATFAPVRTRVPKVEDASFKVMSADPELSVVAPVITRVPLSVIALLVLLKLAVH